jgi:beta-glucosidase
MSTRFHSRTVSKRRALVGAFSVLAVVATASLATVSPASVAAAGCISTSDCLSKMTLAEKAGQMTQAANSYISNPADVGTYALGSVLSGGGGGPNGAGGTASQWKAMVDNYQSYALKSRPRCRRPGCRGSCAARSSAPPSES